MDEKRYGVEKHYKGVSVMNFYELYLFMLIEYENLNFGQLSEAIMDSLGFYGFDEIAFTSKDPDRLSKYIDSQDWFKDTLVAK